MISILFIIFAIVDLIPQVKKINFDKKHLPVGGFLSGFFGGLSGNQGALRSAFLVKHGLEKSVFVATTVAISSLVDITRLSVYSTNFLNLNYSDFYQLGFFSVVTAILYSPNSLLYILYLKGYPRFQITREYLVPFVTGLTLCQTKLGNTIIEPLGLISVHSLIFDFLLFTQST